MEINKINQLEKSAEKMVTDDSLKMESCNSYCPDFSDIFDDSYEFWDFLHSKKDERLKRQELHKRNDFWDFLGPSSNKDQNGLSKESVDSDVTILNDPGLIFENHPGRNSKIKNNVEIVSKGINFKSPELKSTSSDEEFWDFLSCNSPVVTCKELLKDYSSTNIDKESGISSFVSGCNESPFLSVSDYMESEGYSTLNSSPSSVSVKTKHYIGNENETKWENYIDVLKYLQQECVVSDGEVNLSSRPNDNICLYGNSSRMNITESIESDQLNQKRGKTQETNKGPSNKTQLNVSSTNQAPVYDGTVPIFSVTNSDELAKDGNSNGINSFQLGTEHRGRIQKLMTKRPYKRLKRNIPNRSAASHNIVRNSKPLSTNSHLNANNIVNFNQPIMQASLQNLKCANSNHTENGIKSINTSIVNPLDIDTTVTPCATPSLGVTVNNASVNNKSTTSTPLYFLMPTNSDTLQNPNYSHFFLVINNNNGNAQVNQPTFVQNSVIATNTSNLKSTPIQLGQVLQSKVNSEIGTQSDNVKQNVLVVNQSFKAESSYTSEVKSSAPNIKYQTIPQIYLPYTSFINSVEGTSQANVKYINKIPAVNSTANVPVAVSNLVSSSEVPSTISNTLFSSAPITNFYSTVKASGVAEQITNLKSDLKPKVVQPTKRQPLLKPIKNIPLGKDKYAIQQISTPVQICGGEELNNLLGYYSNLNKNESSFLGKELFENNLSPRNNINSSEGLVNNNANFQNILSAVSNKSVNMQLGKNCQSINFTASNVVSSSNLTPSACLMGINSNSQEKGQISTAKSVNVVPVSRSLEINKNVSVVNTIPIINNKCNSNAPSVSLNTANNLVPIKLENSRNKSLATLKELFPPPISMVPVCVLPQTQNKNQASASKVIILNGNGKAQTVTHKLKIDPIPNRQRPMSKKTREKLKKGRLKTVRELLLERRKSSSSTNKPGKEIRVLRPVMRLSTCDVCPSKSSPVLTNISKSDTAVNSKNTEEYSTRKRPNILLLPSSKTMKKSGFTDDKQGSLQKESESKCFADTCTSQNKDNTSSPYAGSTVEKRDSRPRHYDMSQLNIGDFKVDDDIDSCGRFRSKFKVVFSKRLFYYDFPVSRCNQYSLKSTDAWNQMARVAVPFKTIVSMSLNERTIEISINTPPTIALGRFPARTGLVSNFPLYDTAVESDSEWSSMIRNSFHHKIILWKKQANKVKYFLCHFDDRFLNIMDVSLCESGINSVDELSIFDGELSPTTLKQNVTKNKKHYIRRLSQWDSSENEDQKTVDEDDLVLLNQMCSCRVSCRSIRCSCVKAAKSCNSVCDCINCDNPLNILESLGMNLDFSLKDSCLFQNIYQIPKLVSFLAKEVKLTCCNTFARVQDCIPGTVLCPNVDCNVPLEFSWCKKVVCYPERNPRNHCSFCGQCCFSNGRHCMTCNRCYVATPKLPYCPTCQEKTSLATQKDMESNCYNRETKGHDDYQKSSTKSAQEPKIVILNAYSLAKTSTETENFGELFENTGSANWDDSINCEGLISCQDSTNSTITIN